MSVNCAPLLFGAGEGTIAGPAHGNPTKPSYATPAPKTCYSD
jgi:hypothetical protein